MSKIIVVSDSHGLTEELNHIYAHFKDQTHYFLHCGDSELNPNHDLFKIFKTVRGNCDMRDFDSDYMIEIEDKKILVTHGHNYGVKFGLKKLYQYAKEKHANIVCFGHSHKPMVFKYEEITFVNPGSIFLNRGIKGKTFAIITLNEDEVITKHYTLDFNEYNINE